MAFNIAVPPVTFKMRVTTDEDPGFEWKDLTTNEIFANKRIALFGLPGAFTPTCSSTHLPGFEALYPDIIDTGIDEIYCLSVNDSFVMNGWFNGLDIQNVKALPDGAGEFTRKMGFLVDKTNLGFGMRSWRYSMIVNNGIVEMMWVEEGMDDNVEGDPFQVSDAYTMVEYLQREKEFHERAADK
jgi:peroxiredoxin